MSETKDPRHRTDDDWSTLAAELAVHELIAGDVISANQADFARRIIGQQLFVLLVSNCRPFPDQKNLN
jgi:hypothetical protein